MNATKRNDAPFIATDVWLLIAMSAQQDAFSCFHVVPLEGSEPLGLQESKHGSATIIQPS
jgi:hypothetical protein